MVQHADIDHSGVPGVTGLNTIRGRVAAAGTEEADTGGYTVVKNSTGNYTVTFGTPFAATPLVIVQAHHTSGAIRLIFLSAVSTTAFTVITSNFAGTNADAIFSFLAIGY